MRSSQTRDAFTLIEAIAAIVLMSIALPTMLLSIKDAQSRRADPVLLCRARWLAAERIEDILADRASPARGYTYVTPASYTLESVVPGFPGFTRSVAVTETGPSLSGAGTGFKTATVTVGWRDGQSQARTLTLSTVVTSYASEGGP